jgi:HK97 family phage major capsid protein
VRSGARDLISLAVNASLYRSRTHPAKVSQPRRSLNQKNYEENYMSENRRLREERAVIARQMSKMAEGGLKTGEDRAAFNMLDNEQKRLLDQITVIERADSVNAEMRQTGRPPLGQPFGFEGRTEPADGEYREAFGQYLRRGRSELSVEQRGILRLDKHTSGEFRDMGTSGQGAYPGITSGAGIFVPVGFFRRVEAALKYYGPMLNGTQGMPTILDTDTGQPLPMPTSNDTTISGELIAENQQVATADVNIGMVMFGAYKFSTKLVKVSLELIEDSAFDIESFLISQFAERIGRTVNSYLTTGTGTNQPTGIIPATLTGGQTVLAVGASSNDSASGANTIGSDDLTNLEHAIDPLYRPNARYMFSDSTLKAIKKVKDKYGRPLWSLGVRDREPDTINGYEFAVNPYMDNLQTQASSPTVTRNTALFGALSKYNVRRVKQLSVLRLSERFADFGQVAFIGFTRLDGNLLDAGTHPTAVLQNVY